MTEHVVVAVDGGNASRAAINWVIDRAKSVDMELEITTIVEAEVYLPGGAEVDYRTFFEQVLHDARGRVAEAIPTLPVVDTVRRGMPAQTLIELSREADLLVIGTGKTGVITGILHGTLPLKVAGRSTCPTVVVPAYWLPRSGPVVVAWDSDESAERALAFAATEAQRLEVPLDIVHAWPVPPISAESVGAAEMVNDVMDTHRDLLAKAANAVRETYEGLDVTQRLVSSPAAVAVVQAARDASLVVTGSHGRGTIGGLFLGSVSHDILLNMPSPVAVVPGLIHRRRRGERVRH